MSNIVKVGETSEYLDDFFTVHIDEVDPDYNLIALGGDIGDVRSCLILSEEQVVELRDLLNKVIEMHNT